MSETRALFTIPLILCPSVPIFVGASMHQISSVGFITAIGLFVLLRGASLFAVYRICRVSC